MTHLRFSIVIPTYRRPEQLDRALCAIALLDYPKEEFEVVVVSDGPGPETDEIVCRHARTIPVYALSQPHGGPARARNAGADSATGKFLLFLDDDCAPDSDWLHQWDLHSRRNPDAAAGGGTVNSLSGNLCARASQLLFEFIHEYFNADVLGRTPFLASNNLCVSAERFRDLGGFSSDFPRAAAEDRDFCDRWKARGWPACRVPQARVSHAHEMTVAGFLRQHWNYGRGGLILRRQRRRREQSSRVEPARFYADLIFLPWRRGAVTSPMPLCALLCLSQFANVGGFVREWLAGRKPTNSSAFPMRNGQVTRLKDPSPDEAQDQPI